MKKKGFCEKSAETWVGAVGGDSSRVISEGMGQEMVPLTHGRRTPCIYQEWKLFRHVSWHRFEGVLKLGEESENGEPSAEEDSIAEQITTKLLLIADGARW